MSHVSRKSVSQSRWGSVSWCVVTCVVPWERSDMYIMNCLAFFDKIQDGNNNYGRDKNQKKHSENHKTMGLERGATAVCSSSMVA